MNWFAAFVCCFLWCAVAMADEHLIVSGGPALNYFERHKENRHDRYWGNFIDAAAVQIRNIKPSLPNGDRITWLVYRPGYDARSAEENVDYIANITKRAQELGVNLVWFNQRSELIDYINKDRSKGNKVALFEYFGHSNKRCFMFDYSNHLDGGAKEPSTLHMKHLSQIRRSSFSDAARAHSWGCHSGEEYSAAWFRNTGVRMKGAIGKTDYSRMNSLPFLSSEKGRWVQ